MKFDITRGNYVALVGIDWADKKHDLCLFDLRDKTYQSSIIEHSPQSIQNWVESLYNRFKGGQIVIVTELKSGPLISALTIYDFITLVTVPPKSLANYRSTFIQSGAKDDPTDAYLILEFLLRHGDRLYIIQPDTPETRRLQFLVNHRRQHVDLKVKFTNKVRQSVKQYYPQLLDWFEHIDTFVFCDFFETWPTLKKVQKARETTLRKFFFAHNSRKIDTVERRIKGIKHAVPLTSDSVVIDINMTYISSYIKLIRQALLTIKDYDNQIAVVFANHKDHEIFESFPGARDVFAPRLLAAMGSDRQRFDNSDEVARLVGVAPVLERSGKKSWTHWRKGCPTFVRQSFVEWANQTIKQSYWARQYYDQQRLKGNSHQATLRALAFKWIRIIFRCWKDRTVYDESKYLLRLRARSSTLLKAL